MGNPLSLNKTKNMYKLSIFILFLGVLLLGLAIIDHINEKKGQCVIHDTCVFKEFNGTIIWVVYGYLSINEFSNQQIVRTEVQAFTNEESAIEFDNQLKEFIEIPCYYNRKDPYSSLSVTEEESIAFILLVTFGGTLTFMGIALGITALAINQEREREKAKRRKKYDNYTQSTSNISNCSNNLL